MCLDDNQLVFSDEPDPPAVPPSEEGGEPWVVMIVDDEENVHDMTRRVLYDFSFENRSLTFLSAFSGKEARELIAKHPETAVILLDVVMETDDAGLDVVRHIREELDNPFVRIILRTGQPGVAMKKNVIMDYDINDYKIKTDLTAEKLLMAMVFSLRSYNNVRQIQRIRDREKNSRAFERFLEASSSLFELGSAWEVASRMLELLLPVLEPGESPFKTHAGFTVSGRGEGHIIRSATGVFISHVGRSVNDLPYRDIRQTVQKVMENRESLFTGDGYAGYFQERSGAWHIYYVHGNGVESDVKRGLIRNFSRNVAIALENIGIREEMQKEQSRVMAELGEAIENRCKGGGGHAQRVSEYAYLLARKAGLSEEEARVVRYAAPMHGIGKIGIPESILLKQGKLAPEELDTVRNHPTIGYGILKSAKAEIMMTAARIAHQHQERWDGAGYPQGLKGKEIDVGARITAIVDVFDALMHERTYRNAYDADAALALIRREAGKQFDPELTRVFLENADLFLGDHREA